MDRRRIRIPAQRERPKAENENENPRKRSMKVEKVIRKHEKIVHHQLQQEAPTTVLQGSSVQMAAR
jgi:hypothetical protein